MAARRSLRGRLAGLFAVFALGALLVMGLALWTGAGRAEGGFVLAGVIEGFGVLGGIVGLWYLIDSHVARPVDLLAGHLRARAHGDGGAVADVPGLGDLGPAAVAMADALAQTRAALDAAVARETARLEGEKSRLEALLADVPLGVVLCSEDHMLAFYNGAAVEMIGLGAGLDRRLFDYLREGPIRMAHARLAATGDPDATSDLLTTSRDGGRVLAARMRLRAGAGGYVLTLRDVTHDLATEAARDGWAVDALDQMRRPATNLALLLAAAPDDVPLQAEMRAEVARLTQSAADLTARHSAAQADAGMLVMTRAADLLDGIRARIEADGLAATTDAPDLLLRCNGFEVIALLSGLAEDMGAAGIASAFDLEVEEEGAGAMIRLAWLGPPLPLAQMEAWLDAPLERGLTGLSRRAVLVTHATDIWPQGTGQGRHALCLPIPRARRGVSRPTPVPRPVVYDFDLLSKTRTASVQDSPLSALTYVVFDTETTGLNPDQGDEIVQIAALRIVNGRRVEGEVFDTLVDPGRPIPALSTAVHGITDAMVQGAPRMTEVAARFHDFAKGAVLVAHNAPFDMAFLRRSQSQTGLGFDHPVLDTVLLSAVIFGQHEVHTLDALIHRLGLTIPEEARHTALGDTIATADAFLRLMPMLEGRGLGHFGAVIAEVRRHGRLLKDLN